MAVAIRREKSAGPKDSGPVFRLPPLLDESKAMYTARSNPRLFAEATDGDGRTLLHDLVWRYKKVAMYFAAKDPYFLVEIKNNRGWSALHEAVHVHEDVALYLMKSNPAVLAGTFTNLGRSALQTAIISHKEVAAYAYKHRMEPQFGGMRSIIREIMERYWVSAAENASRVNGLKADSEAGRHGQVGGEQARHSDVKSVRREDKESGLREKLIKERANGKRDMEDFWIENDWLKWDEHGAVTFSRAIWKESETRIKGIRYLVETVLGKDPRDMKALDFRRNRLNGLLAHHYRDEPYLAIASAFPELRIKPWEMGSVPRSFYEDRDNRIAVIRWLAEERLQKSPGEISEEDFNRNRLGPLLAAYYGGAAADAVMDAYPADANPELLRNRGYVLKAFMTLRR